MKRGTANRWKGKLIMMKKRWSTTANLNRKIIRLFPVMMLVVALNILAGCASGRNTVPPRLTQNMQPFTVSIYSGGKIVSSHHLSASSTFVHKVNSVIASCAGRWTKSDVSYAPLIYIQSSKRDFSVTFQEHRIVINYKDSKLGDRQIVAPIKQAQFEAVRHLGATSSE